MKREHSRSGFPARRGFSIIPTVGMNVEIRSVRTQNRKALSCFVMGALDATFVGLCQQSLDVRFPKILCQQNRVVSDVERLLNKTVALMSDKMRSDWGMRFFF